MIYLDLSDDFPLVSDPSIDRVPWHRFELCSAEGMSVLCKLQRRKSTFALKLCKA